MPPYRTSWRFSLATLFAAIFAAGVCCTVLPYPFVAFYSVITLLVLTSAAARNGPAEQRLFWFWFSLAGWTYILVGMALLEYWESTATWHSLRGWLEERQPGLAWWTPRHYLALAHGVLAMLVALTAGLIGTRGLQRRV